MASVLQGILTPGFDFTRHSWSLLSLGQFGWVHVATFVVAGALTLAFAVGLRRSLREGRGARAAPILVGSYGACLIIAGALTPDPMSGFPLGSTASTTLSAHALGHFVAGSIGFAAIIAACFVLASRFRREGASGWATFSVITGIVFLASFVGIASGAGNVAINLAFTAGVVLSWTWMTAVAMRLRSASA